MPLALAHPEFKLRPAEATVEVGLLNNLSDAGLERGERQIIDLLGEAAGERRVRLSLFSMPSIKRAGDAVKAHISACYMPFDLLMRDGLDGLIVTGCEPGEESLSREAFWPELASVIDWAEHNTHSTIWSCLSAHAAVLHLDGIKRRRLPEKLCGLYPVTAIASHPIISGAPTISRVPHSRWNQLDSAELSGAGYTVLTRGEAVGADVFVKAWRSLFVYLQGHPEYDAGALAREYRRDVGRYLDGGSFVYPKLPENYFDPLDATALFAFAQRAGEQRDPKLARGFPVYRSTVAQSREFGVVLFRNWLTYIEASSSRQTTQNTYTHAFSAPREAC